MQTPFEAESSVSSSYMHNALQATEAERIVSRLQNQKCRAPEMMVPDLDNLEDAVS